MVDLLPRDPQAALTLGRLVFALVSLALLVTAIWLCWGGHSTPLIGLAVAISPGVLWAAAALRLGRDPGALRRGWWDLRRLRLAGPPVARPPGPGWLALYLLLFLAYARHAGLRAAVAPTPRSGGGE